MATYPDDIFEPRTVENLPGISYDAAEFSTGFAEDYSLPADEIVAIQETLGTNPEGAYATVKAWLTDISADLVSIFASLFWEDATGGIAYTSGNVGIRTTSPAYALDVKDSSGSAVALRLTGTNNNNTQLRFAGATGGELFAIGTDVNAGDGAEEYEIYDLKNSVSRLLINSSGNVGIGTTSPSGKLDVNDDHVRIRTAKTPANAGAAGDAGDVAWDSNYVYVCVATNTWKRSPLASW